MENMSYCRYQNTLNDLRDCFNDMMDVDGKLSADEQMAKNDLIEMCQAIVNVSKEEEAEANTQLVPGDGPGWEGGFADNH